MGSTAARADERLQPYQRLLARHHAYAVAVERLQRRLAPAPLGIPIAAEHRFDPTRRSSAPFLRLLERLDALAYGFLNLVMPRWAFYDCAELPGLIFGLGQHRRELAPAAADALGIPVGEEGLVPVTMYTAVPMLDEGHWLGYGICSLHEVVPSACPPGLGVLSIALALEALGARGVTGTVQWASPRLRTHARFAPLEVRAAWLPAHTEPATCVFSFELDADRIGRALRVAAPERGADTPVLDVADEAALRALQRDVESGRRVQVVGPPEERGALACVPLLRGARS